MQFLKKSLKYMVIGNATVLFTLLLLPVFLVTNQVDALSSIIDFLWKQDL
ncbi:hypothetical protein [Pueribacillus theae]|nr:hypothetical protein [Pueribacillus theae]